MVGARACGPSSWLSVKNAEMSAIAGVFSVAAYFGLQGFANDRRKSWCFFIAAPRAYSLSARAVIHSQSQE
jgi:hypothetical protein